YEVLMRGKRRSERHDEWTLTRRGRPTERLRDRGRAVRSERRRERAVAPAQHRPGQPVVVTLFRLLDDPAVGHLEEGRAGRSTDPDVRRGDDLQGPARF